MTMSLTQCKVSTRLAGVDHNTENYGSSQILQGCRESYVIVTRTFRILCEMYFRKHT